MKRIGDILTRNKTAVVVEDDTSYKQVTIRTNYKGVVLRGSQDGATILTKNQFAVSAGQFILSRIDARNGAFGIVPEELEGAIVTNDFLAFDINEEEVEREFFNVFLQSPVFLEACIKASRGNTNRKRVDEDFFLNYPVNLPPLPDQHDLIKQINKGRTKLALAQHEITHQQALLARLKQAILQEAIQGKLTAGWRAANPDVEPASRLLQRIQVEKNRLIAAKKLRPEKPLQIIISADTPFDIPMGWEWCRFGSMAKVWNGFAFSSQEFTTEGVPVIRIGDLVNGNVVTTKSPRISLAKAGELAAHFWIPKGALLIAMSGATIGKTAINNSEVKLLLNQRVGRIEPIKNNVAFVKLFLDSIIQKNLEISYGAAQPNLSTEQINETLFPLPPLAEQAAIVERVEAVMATCRALEAEIEHARTHAAHLLQAVLKEAFAPVSGNLDSTPPAQATTPISPVHHDAFTALVQSMRTKGSLASSDAQTATGLDAAGVRPLLQRLIAEGHARIEGQKRGTRYVAT
jgi:type I restriction enzyme S subunit